MGIARGYVRVADLARWLCVSRTTIWRWTRRGVLPAPVVIGGVRRWQLAAVEARLSEFTEFAGLKNRAADDGHVGGPQTRAFGGGSPNDDS